MPHKLQVKAFFFNAKTDYLPYYKHFSLSLADDAVAKDILIAISEQNWDFSYPELNLVFKINDLVVDEYVTVSDIIEELGTELIIDPVNSYRSTNGLIINNDDFMQSFELLAPYASDADKAYYKTLYALHYASETENFDREYIGDAILVLAHKMIKDGNENKEEILTAITSASSGLLDCEYENNLFDAQYHTKSINELKDMLSSDNDNHPSLLDMIKNALNLQKVETEVEIPKAERERHTLEDLALKQTAYYAGTQGDIEAMSQLFGMTDTKEITFKRKHKLSGLAILETSKTLALKKAGATLLDAFDSGAEVLVVHDTDTFDMFTNNYSKIEKIAGREIIGLELICEDDYMHQVTSIDE